MSAGFTTAFCYDLGALTGAIVAELVSSSLAFAPARIRTSGFLRSGGKFDRNKHVQLLHDMHDLDTVHLETDAKSGGPSFQLATIASWNTQVLYWRNAEPTLPDSRLLDRLTGIVGFNAGYRYNEDDVFWQSEELVSTYEVFGRNYSRLKRVGDRVDISMNPGRRTLFPGMWLQAAWEMWFGKGSLRYFSRDRLLAVPFAERVELLDTGAVFIRLYKDATTYEDSAARYRLARFRTWVGMDDLESQASEIALGHHDVALEIEEGTFEHGGVRRETFWLDEEGKPRRKSKAVRAVITEYDQTGRVVWSSEQ